MNYPETAKAVAKLGAEDQFKIVQDIMRRQVKRVESVDGSALVEGWGRATEQLRAYCVDIGNLSQATDDWIERGYQIKAFAKEQAGGIEVVARLLRDTVKITELRARKWPPQGYARKNREAIMGRADWVRLAVRALHKHPEHHGMVERYRKLWGGDSVKVDPQVLAATPKRAAAAPPLDANRREPKYNPYKDKNQTRLA